VTALGVIPLVLAWSDIRMWLRRRKAEARVDGVDQIETVSRTPVVFDK
jgi:hypothetical protein